MSPFLSGDEAQGPDGAGLVSIIATQGYLGGLFIALLVVLAILHQTAQTAAVHHEGAGRKDRAAAWRLRERPAWLPLPTLVASLLVVVVARAARLL